MSIGRKPYAKPAVVTHEPCLFDGCENFAERDGAGVPMKFCRGHRKQQQRGQPMRPLRRWVRRDDANVTTRERLQEYVLRYADAEGDDDEERAWSDLLRAFRTYFREGVR